MCCCSFSMGSCCSKCTAVVHVEQQQQPPCLNLNDAQQSKIVDSNFQLSDTAMTVSHAMITSSQQLQNCHESNNNVLELINFEPHSRAHQPSAVVEIDCEQLQQQVHTYCIADQPQQKPSHSVEEQQLTTGEDFQQQSDAKRQTQVETAATEQLSVQPQATELRQKLAISCYRQLKNYNDEQPSACGRCFVPPSPSTPPPLTTTDEETVQPDVEEWISNIKTCRQSLLHILDVTDSGLLDELISKTLLSQQQTELIRTLPTSISKVDQLLNYVKDFTGEQLEQFLSTLDKTGQSHVANYIQCNGQRPKINPDNWPIYGNSQSNRIYQNWRRLKEMTDSRNGLLDELYSLQCISCRQKSSIEAHTKDDDRNDHLFSILLRKSFSDFNTFIRCLASTKQCAVIAILQPNGQHIGLSEQHEQLIQQNYSFLVEHIESRDSSLLTELRSADCITWRQKEYIESAATQSESNKRLLDIIRRGCDVDLRKFVECLNRADQQHVSEIITGIGAVAQIVAKNSGCHNLEENEDRIVAKFKLLLRNREVCDESLASEINEELQKLGSGVKVVAMTTRNSIGLHFLCKSLHELHFLYELYCSKELQTIIQRLFTALCNGQTVHVDRLIWKTSDFNNCAQYLSRISDLPIHSWLYQLAYQSLGDAVDVTDDCLIDVERFPHELIEMLLLKTAGQLFVVLNKMTSSRADIGALTTLCAVCGYWGQTLTCRNWNRRLLKNYISSVCRPHKLEQQLMISLCVEGRSVVGVAQLLHKLYVATAGCISLQVFDLNPPYVRLDDIEIKKLVETADIATCKATNNVFIADCVTRDIWCVSVLKGNEVTKFDRTPFIPKTISINPTRLTLVPNDGRSLHVYPASGDKENISMPDYMRVHHAVEAYNCRSFVVCYTTNLQISKSGLGNICEIDKKGRVLRQYCRTDGPTSLVDGPCYLSFSFDQATFSPTQETSSILSDRFLLVADQARRQIQLFNSNLTLRRVLLSELDDLLEIDFNEETRLIAVAYSYSARVNLFSV